jgi:hypothetical protein
MDAVCQNAIKCSVESGPERYGDIQKCITGSCNRNSFGVPSGMGRCGPLSTDHEFSNTQVYGMNWAAISATAEITGAIAVVVSLVYLATQIRQNTRQISNSIQAAHLAALERNIDSGIRTREFYLLNPDLMELFGRGRRSYLDLDSTEKVKFSFMIRNVFAEFQGAYIRQSSTAHDPEGHIGITRLVDDMVSARGVQEFLGSADPDWRPAFRKFVDERLALAINARNGNGY